MYVYRNISWGVIFRFAWQNVVFFILWATLIAWAYHYLEHTSSSNIAIPFLPLSTIGIAVAFYIGFKNNSSYDRFWEARKIWGGIVNYSRTWGNHAMTFIGTKYAVKQFSQDEIYALQKEVIYRHIAWMNALRHQLRQPKSFTLKANKSTKKYYHNPAQDEHWQEDVGAFLDQAEFSSMCKYTNIATQLIRKQGQSMKWLNDEAGLIDEFRYMEMMRVQEEFYNLQGKCERINNTPFPRQYAYFSKVFTWIFVILLPFGLVGEFAKLGHSMTFLMVPFSVLISWIFVTMEVVGDNSEDPFDNFINDVPMTALCRTIEIDLREMLGETDLPPKIQPTNGILM